MSDDVLACARVDPPGAVVFGSVQLTCADCDAAVWVAPSGLKLVARGVLPVCLQCAGARVRRDPDPRFMPPSAEQLGEVGEMLRRSR